MRISSPGPTLILTGRGSDIRLTVSGLSDGHRIGAGRMDRADGGGDRQGRKDKRADGGGGDASEAIVAEHFRSPLTWVVALIPPTIGVTPKIKQGPCQVPETAGFRQKCLFRSRNHHLNLANRW